MASWLIICAFWGVTPGVKGAKEPEPEVLAALDRARALAPEFAADQILRVLEAGRVADAKAGADLAESAFRLAAGASQDTAWQFVAAGGFQPPDDARRTASQWRIDRLSLQARAVAWLSGKDWNRAEALFEGIALGPGIRPECGDRAALDRRIYFELAADLAKRVPAGEGAEERRLRILGGALAQAATPLDVASAIVLVRAAPELGGTLSALAGRLKPSGAELRFARGDGARAAMAGYVGDARRLEALAPLLGMLKSVEPCAEGEWDADIARLEGFAKMAAGFGDEDGSVRRALLAQPPFPPVAERLRGRLTSLFFGADGRPANAAERAKPEWKQRLSEALREAQDWKAEDTDSEPAFFHWKCRFYDDVMELMGAQTEARLTFAEFAGYVGSESARVSRFEWMGSAARLLKRWEGSPERAEWIETLRRADAALGAYAELSLLLAR